MAKKKTPAAVQVVESTSLFQVKKRVRHDGERYVPGEEIELTEAQAEHLLSVGAVIPVVPIPVVQPATETDPQA